MNSYITQLENSATHASYKPRQHEKSSRLAAFRSQSLNYNADQTESATSLVINRWNGLALVLRTLVYTNQLAFNGFSHLFTF